MPYQDQFRALIDKAEITQSEAADLIASNTRRPCSVRSIRAWLTDRSNPSARPCPEWAVQALDAQLKYLRKSS